MPNFQKLAWMLLFPLLIVSQRAQAAWWATEWTQIANFGELTYQTLSNAKAVALEYEQLYSQLKQEAMSVRNMLPVDPARVMAAYREYQNQLNEVTRIYNTVSGYANTLQAAIQSRERRSLEMKRLGMNLADYLRAEIDLSNAKGGSYKERLENDMATIDQLVKRSGALKDLQSDIASIGGNVEGLQLLNRQSASITSELMDLRLLFQQQQAAANAEKVSIESAKSQVATEKLNAISKLKAREAQVNNDLNNAKNYVPSSLTGAK